MMWYVKLEKVNRCRKKIRDLGAKLAWYVHAFELPFVPLRKRNIFELVLS